MPRQGNIIEFEGALTMRNNNLAYPEVLRRLCTTIPQQRSASTNR